MASPGVADQSSFPNPSSDVLKSIRTPDEDTTLIHKKKCEYLCAEAEECEERIREKHRPSSRLASVGGRLLAAASINAKRLLDECSEEHWLLKAVELWDCTEHFVEIIFDLWWSAHIISSGDFKVDEGFIDEKRNALKERNREDEKDLRDRVQRSESKQDSAESALAQILRGRLEKTPFSKTPSFSTKNHTAGSKSGANGAIMKFKWVFGKDFAVKTRHPEENGHKTFQREYNILDKNRSPYIVEVVGYWEAEESFRRAFKFMCILPTPRLSPLLLMESLDIDLKDLMDKCKPKKETEGFSGLDTIRLMLPIAKALRFLHQRDVVHRDLKPQDIMCKNVKLLTANSRTGPEETLLNEDIIVKLIDFGEAREKVSSIPHDQWGPAGTPGYMDPVLWKHDDSKYSLFMGDVFSFAMVFAELLTWKSPLQTLNVQIPSDVQEKQDVEKALRPYEAQRKLRADKRPQLPNELPKYLKFIVESCWHVDYRKRPNFTAICSMLQYAKVLLLDKDAFACEDGFTYKGAFTYKDGQGVSCCISDQT